MYMTNRRPAASGLGLPARRRRLGALAGVVERDDRRHDHECTERYRKHRLAGAVAELGRSARTPVVGHLAVDEVVPKDAVDPEGDQGEPDHAQRVADLSPSPACPGSALLLPWSSSLFAAREYLRLSDERKPGRAAYPPGSDEPAKKRNQIRKTKPAVITETTITTSRIWRGGRPSLLAAQAAVPGHPYAHDFGARKASIDAVQARQQLAHRHHRHDDSHAGCRDRGQSSPAPNQTESESRSRASPPGCRSTGRCCRPPSAR